MAWCSFTSNEKTSSSRPCSTGCLRPRCRSSPQKRPRPRTTHESLGAALRQEADRLIRDSRQVRLFLEYWAVGTRHPGIRAKISAELERYRDSFRRLTEEVLAAEPSRFMGVSSKGLTAVAVSFVNGCAVQAMIDPARFDVEKYLAALRAMLGGLARLPCAPASGRG